ncbi:Phage regulatory protein Rha [compost metagenome]
MNSITSFTPTDLITLYHGQPMTTSLKVAELFEKRHDNVLRKLESLECSAEFHRLNFEEMSQEVDIGNGAKRKTKIWNMTKDGFIFVVMGFTGAKAAATKEAYINAFNWMAEQLSLSGPRGINLPAANGSDGTYCGRLLVSVEYSQITGCRPLPNNAFIATADSLGEHIRTPGSFSIDQLRQIAELSLSGIASQATALAQLSHVRRLGSAAR